MIGTYNHSVEKKILLAKYIRTTMVLAKYIRSRIVQMEINFGNNVHIFKNYIGEVIVPTKVSILSKKIFLKFLSKG